MDIYKIIVLLNALLGLVLLFQYAWVAPNIEVVAQFTGVVLIADALLLMVANRSTNRILDKIDDVITKQFESAGGDAIKRME